MASTQLLNYWQHTLGFIPPIIASVIAGPLLYNMVSNSGICKTMYPSTKALVVGFLVSIVIYFLLKILNTWSQDKDANIIGKSVLAGLLAAKGFVFTSNKLATIPPSMSDIAMWLFLWYSTIEH
jgi:hypothetical protein